MILLQSATDDFFCFFGGKGLDLLARLHHESDQDACSHGGTMIRLAAFIQPVLSSPVCLAFDADSFVAMSKKESLKIPN